MDGNKPKRRRELTPKEKKALEKQRQKERELARKKAREDAKYREQYRRKARQGSNDPGIIVEIPARPTPPPKKKKRKKSIPDIIECETDKRVRDLDPADHKDGFYVNEVGVRKAQAEKQRKKKQKRQPKVLSPKVRRRRRVIASVAIIVTVIIIGVVLSLTVLFKTDNIVIKNNKYYDDQTVLNFTNVHEGENIFIATLTGDTKSISDALPYVKSAKIGFEIPNTLVITLENETPYSSYKSSGKYYLVSKENRILEEVSGRPADLMFVDAPKLKSTEIGDYVEFEKQNYTNAMEEITQSLVKNGYSDITGISIKRISDITITYDNRILIRLGMPDNLDYKIRTAFTIINQKLDPNGTKTAKGCLNVSNCKTTKRSYFDPNGYGDEAVTIAPTVAETTEPESVRTTYVTSDTEPTTDPEDYGEYETDNPDEYFTETPIEDDIEE